MALDLGTLVAYVEADDTQYNAVLDRSEGRMRRFGGALAAGLKVAGGAFLTVAGAATTVGITTAASNEQAQISFTTMLNSGAKAQKFLGELGAFAAKTPFGFPELQTAAQSLISAGVNAGKVIPIMTSLGNATSGMGTGAEGVKRATVAIQQMNAAGKISAEDLNQLRDAGIPVYDLLAAATGKSTEKLADMASKGKLGRKELGQLMTALESGKGLERFNGMMEKQATSLSGLWSTLKDEFQMGMATAVQPLIPLLKDGLGVAIKFVSDQAPRLAAGFAIVVAGARGLYDLIVGGDFSAQLRKAFGWEEDSGAVTTILRIRDAAMGLYNLIVGGDFTGQLRSAFGWSEDSGAVDVILRIRDAAIQLKDMITGGNFAGDLQAAFGWDASSPAVTAISDIKDAVSGAFESISSGASGLQGLDFAALGGILSQVAVGARDLMESAPAVGPSIELIGDALSWVSQNADTVGAALPYVLAAFAAFKAAQAANSVIGQGSALGMIAQVTSTLTLAAANRSLAASQRGVTAATAAATATTASNTAANNAGVLTRLRAVAGMVASRVATIATSVATGIATAAQWLWNVALNANPIGLVVLAIAALVGGLIYAWKNSETFRNVVLSVWAAIKGGVLAVIDWLKVAVPAVFAWVKSAFLRYTPLGIIISHWGQIRSFIGGAVDRVKAIIAWFAELPGKFADWFGRARDAVNSKVAAVVTLVKGLPGRILTALGNVGGMLADKGRDLVSGLISGIREMGGKLAGFVKQFIKDHIPGPIADALGINSPSKVAAALTRYVPLGAIEGMKSTGPQLRRFTEDLFDLGNISATVGFSPALAAGVGGFAPGAGAASAGSLAAPAVVKHYRPVHVERMETADYGSFMDEVAETERQQAIGGPL